MNNFNGLRSTFSGRCGYTIEMNILERYRLALSYKEKAEQEHRDWLELVKKKTFDQTHYDLVKATYDRHIKQATELCDTIDRAQKSSLGALEEELFTISAQQKKLIRDTEAGQIKAKKANELGRLLANEQHRIQTPLDTARTIVSTESTKMLGGFIDHPFEEYELKLGIVGEPESAVITETKSAPEFKLKNVALIVAVGLLLWWGANYYGSIGKASWSSEVTDHRQFLNIECTNTGNRTIRVYAPWPEGRTDVEAVSSSLNRVSFGALLYVREKGSSQFQLLPETPAIWSARGRAHTTASPITVASGKKLTLKLDTLELRKSGLKIDVIKVVMTRYGGRNVHSTQEIILP